MYKQPHGRFHVYLYWFSLLWNQKLYLSSSIRVTLPHFGFAQFIAYKHWSMIAQPVRRVRRNHWAQWSSFLLRYVMKESSNSIVWILFSPFPSLRFPTYAFPPNWAVLRTVVKCLHAHPCCTELQCGTPGKMVQIMRGMTVWYFSFLEVIKRENGKFIELLPNDKTKIREDSCYFINGQHNKIS